MKPIRFHAEARAEVLAVGDWYENEELGLRREFASEWLLPSSVFKPNRIYIGRWKGAFGSAGLLDSRMRFCIAWANPKSKLSP